MRLFNILYLLITVYLPSFLFCVRCLPWKQTKKIPIVLYNCKILKMGVIEIVDNKPITRGMIKLGLNSSIFYPEKGIVISNHGKLVFHGRCSIGNNSVVSTGINGTINFGDSFRATTSLKICSHDTITFGEQTLIGWDVIIQDTDFHLLFDKEKQTYTNPTKAINIVNKNWLASKTMILKGVNTPNDVVFGAGSIATSSTRYQAYCVYAGSPIKCISQNKERILGHDDI
jgi:acetyltransferase-like isoleucine patch superfamily enzyme